MNEVDEQNTEWEKLIPACFGREDGKFARHDCDIKDAKRICKIIQERNIDTNIVLQKIRDYLNETFTHQAAQNDQEMERVEKFFRNH